MTYGNIFQDHFSWPVDWPPPNYVDPETRGAPALFIATAIITAIVVVLRLYSRFYLSRSPGIDDAFIIAAFLLSIGQTFAEYRNLTVWGWDRHIWDNKLEKLPHVRFGAWLLQFFFILGIGCTKISILFVYRRISNGSDSIWPRRLTIAAIAFTSTYTLAYMFELFLMCQPLDTYWKAYDINWQGHFKCGNDRIPIMLSVVLNFISDFYAILLPMFLVQKLQMSRKQRIGLVILFSFGMFTVMTGAVRIYYLNKVTTQYKPGPHASDTTWLGWPVNAWTDVEAHLAILCACAPALKVLFKKKIKTPLTSAVTTARRSTVSLYQRSIPSKRQSWRSLLHMRTPSPTEGMQQTSERSTPDLMCHGSKRLEIVHVQSDRCLQPVTHQDWRQQYERDLEKGPGDQVIEVDKSVLAFPPRIWGSPDSHASTCKAMKRESRETTFTDLSSRRRTTFIDVSRGTTFNDVESLSDFENEEKQEVIRVEEEEVREDRDEEIKKEPEVTVQEDKGSEDKAEAEQEATETSEEYLPVYVSASLLPALRSIESWEHGLETVRETDAEMTSDER